MTQIDLGRDDASNLARHKESDDDKGTTGTRPRTGHAGLEGDGARDLREALQITQSALAEKLKPMAVCSGKKSTMRRPGKNHAVV
jgi:hypothetical protein